MNRFALRLALGLVSLSASCSAADAPNPFADGGLPPPPTTGPTGTGGGGGGGVDAGPDADPTLGGPCEDHAQCDDGISCTSDACDLELKLCRFTPDAAPCQNGVFCDGEEVCDLKLGCRA